MKFTKIVALIFLMILAFGCKEKQNGEVVHEKSNAEIELEETREILEAIGEKAITDTSQYKRFLYCGQDVLSRSTISCVKDLNDDSLAVVSLMWIRYNQLQYSNDSLTSIGELYSFIGNLKKVTQRLNCKKSNKIFEYFQVLISKKMLLPIGEEIKRDRFGDIVEGGNWLFYYDGKKFYKYTDYNSYHISTDSIYSLLEKNIDFKTLVEELQRPY
jgi:hypothetical protein